MIIKESNSLKKPIYYYLNQLDDYFAINLPILLSKHWYQIFFTLSIIYNGIIVPFCIGFLPFSSLDTHEKTNLYYFEYFYTYMNRITDIILLIHIIGQFYQSYYEYGIIVIDRKKKIYHYLSSNFIIDLLAIIPFYNSILRLNHLLFKKVK